MLEFCGQGEGDEKIPISGRHMFRFPDDFQAHLAEEELAPLRLELGLLALSVVVLDVCPHAHPVEVHAQLPQQCIFHQPDIVFLVLELLLQFLTCDLADLGCNSIDMIQ